MCPIQNRFTNESRQRVWVAGYSGVREPKNPDYQTASQTWFKGLLTCNARVQEKWSQFANLKAFGVVIPELVSVANFCGAMIENFKDKDAVKTTSDSLKRSKQGSMSVSEFNSCF
ncbi:hypothetical protein CROQUDRAFT_37149 [Cronartium quercuum f. sp. fusiforme G11]|uniref:Uncharacterized protein n=1 Tax=Cronartium quercuum f. sp. fusiforme G11 TaxID=708437 RepID=A0A9P6NXJ2_9BASI|nr:hypothetical protein CROQUDRAFT_37149 [Cronartium quercuum f. sp. fusiforme G11]